MARRVSNDRNEEPLPPPATTLEGREDQLIERAYNLAERRMHDGTASSPEVVHFLKAGSRKEQMLLEKIQAENDVLRARVADLQSRANYEDTMKEALNAFKGYSGEIPVNVEDDYDDDPDVY